MPSKKAMHSLKYNQFFIFLDVNSSVVHSNIFDMTLGCGLTPLNNSCVKLNNFEFYQTCLKIIENFLWDSTSIGSPFLCPVDFDWPRPFFFFFFFCSPAISLGFTTFWVRFLRMWPFFNPTIKVVTFRLRRWCVLGVFLLLAFTRLGHERQDLLSPCDEMHVCTD